jgi:ParB family chromosome partitioning protein
MIKAKGLGKGLDALLGGGAASNTESEYRQLVATALVPGKYQPRTRMDQGSLQELADSIRERGVVQPILVRQVGEKFEIIAGERRWRAAQIAGLTDVPVLVRKIADDAALGIGLIENIQREDLSAMEEASGLQRLIQEFKLTHEEAAKAVGRSRSAVSNLLRLLELAKPVQDMLLESKLEMGHARALLSLGRAKQVELAHQIVHKTLSVREAERLVKREQDAPRTTSKAKTQDADTRRLETELADKLGAAVSLVADKKGRGTLTIAFQSFEELDGILERTRLK